MKGEVVWQRGLTLLGRFTNRRLGCAEDEEHRSDLQKTTPAPKDNPVIYVSPSQSTVITCHRSGAFLDLV